MNEMFLFFSAGEFYGFFGSRSSQFPIDENGVIISLYSLCFICYKIYLCFASVWAWQFSLLRRI